MSRHYHQPRNPIFISNASLVTPELIADRTPFSSRTVRRPDGKQCYHLEALLLPCPDCAATDMYVLRCYGDAIFEQCHACGRTRRGTLSQINAYFRKAYLSAATLNIAVHEALR